MQEARYMKKRKIMIIMLAWVIIMMVMVVMMKMPSKKERVWQVFKNILSGPARSWSAFNPWSGRSRGSQ